MSSPLEGRIRALAREEAATLLGVGTLDSANTDPVATLDLKVTELAAMVKRFDARLGALETATGQADQETPAPTRRTRKTAE